jgi:hypothetical protein
LQIDGPTAPSQKKQKPAGLADGLLENRLHRNAVRSLDWNPLIQVGGLRAAADRYEASRLAAKEECPGFLVSVQIKSLRSTSMAETFDSVELGGLYFSIFYNHLTPLTIGRQVRRLEKMGNAISDFGLRISD